MLATRQTEALESPATSLASVRLLFAANPERERFARLGIQGQPLERLVPFDS
jgi:hypothetical protein